MPSEPPTNADAILRRLSRENDVPEKFGERLRPLVQRAVDSSPERRRVLLRIVSRSFREEGRRVAEARANSPLEEKDREILYGIAKILHDWNPGSSPGEHLPPD